jgi:glycerophosphoryl diester phosphodiesterase
VLAVAHRAGNDLAALRAAALLGADVIEADVHLSGGQLEVRHEKSLGPLPWRWEKWQLTPRDPEQLMLQHLLDALPPRTTVMLDLKGVGRVGVETVRHLHARSPEHPVLVCARWWPSVAPFRGVGWAQVLLSARGRTELARLRRLLRTGAAPDGVSLHLSLLTPELVAEIKEQVPLVLTWPVDDPASLAAAERVGVDGVITKDLEIVRRVVAARLP